MECGRKIILLLIVVFVGYSQYSIKCFVGDETGIEFQLHKPKFAYALRLSYYNVFREHKFTGAGGAIDNMDFSFKSAVLYWDAYDISLWGGKTFSIHDHWVAAISLGLNSRLYTRYKTFPEVKEPLKKAKKYDVLRTFYTWGIKLDINYHLTRRVSIGLDGIILGVSPFFEYAYPYKNYFLAKFFQGMGQIGIKYNLKQ